MNPKAVLIILTLIFLTACENNAAINPQAKDEPLASPSAVSVSVNEKYNIYYSLSNYKLKKYEPEYGCYSGAYILADKSIGYDISQFELKTSRHASYKYHLKLGEEFPISWILTCYKDQKLPFIIISPEDTASAFNYSIITDYAKKFGELDIPILIGFYPEPAKNNYSPELYKKFFAYARSEFNTYAPNTAFAFITNSDEVYKTDDYFPGNEAVDWVGIDLYLPIENNAIKNSSLSSLNYFYNKFQSKYPIMISSLGISNYTSDNHKYYISDAAYEISNLYNEIQNKYPRIKAVYYMDFDNSSILPYDNTAKNPNSFLITNDDEVTQSYKRAIQSSYFKNVFEEKQNDEAKNTPQKILCKSLAVMKNNELYIPCSLAENLGFLADYSTNAEINGEPYANISALAQINNLNITKENNFIYIGKD